jgi:hypothetical protein
MTTKELQLVTFEQAKKLKELGFDWPVETGNYLIDKIPPCYNRVYPIDKLKVGDFIGNNILGITIPAPSVALALKWVRDEKGISACIIDLESSEKDTPAQYDFRIKGYYPYPGYYNTCEEAESALLNEVLRFLEEEK